MTSDTPYQRMLNLIAKHAPRLMREGAYETEEKKTKRTRFSESEIRSMVVLKNQGKTNKEIAKIIGCRQISVWRNLKKVL